MTRTQSWCIPDRQRELWEDIAWSERPRPASTWKQLCYLNSNLNFCLRTLQTNLRLRTITRGCSSALDFPLDTRFVSPEGEGFPLPQCPTAETYFFFMTSTVCSRRSRFWASHRQLVFSHIWMLIHVVPNLLPIHFFQAMMEIYNKTGRAEKHTIDQGCSVYPRLYWWLFDLTGRIRFACFLHVDVEHGPMALVEVRWHK